jgi:hypothetical protein
MKLHQASVWSVAMILVAACSGGGGSASATDQSGDATARADNPQMIAAANSATSAQPTANRCSNIRGQLIDADPVGRNVRDAPNANARRLGAIPPPFMGTEGVAFPAAFDIIDSRNGWLLIENAGFDEALVGPNAPASYRGRGWISGRGVMVTVQASRGFASPTHASTVIIDGSETGSIIMGSNFEGLTYRGVHECSGQWVQLDWQMPADSRGVSAISYERSAVVSENPTTLRAWFAGVCNVQETSCDGINGDNEDTAFSDN